MKPYYLACVLACLPFLAGCNPFSVGPVEIVLNAGETSYPGILLKQVPLPATLPFCALPTEEEFENAIQSVGGIDISRFARITALELKETRFEAVQGDFSFASSATIRFRPAAGLGEPFIMGTASAPNGFGTAMQLVPPQRLDLLDIIRANDSAPQGLCPILETEFALRNLLLAPVRFQTVVVIDAYVELNLF